MPLSSYTSYCSVISLCVCGLSRHVVVQTWTVELSWRLTVLQREHQRGSLWRPTSCTLTPPLQVVSCPVLQDHHADCKPNAGVFYDGCCRLLLLEKHLQWLVVHAVSVRDAAASQRAGANADHDTGQSQSGAALWVCVQPARLQQQEADPLHRLHVDQRLLLSCLNDSKRSSAWTAGVSS